MRMRKGGCSVAFGERQSVLLAIDLCQLHFSIGQHARLVMLREWNRLLQDVDSLIGVLLPERNVRIEEHKLRQLDFLIVLSSICGRCHYKSFGVAVVTLTDQRLDLPGHS